MLNDQRVSDELVVISNVMGIEWGSSGDVRLTVTGDAMGFVSKYIWDLGVVPENGVHKHYSICLFQGVPCPFWPVAAQVVQVSSVIYPVLVLQHSRGQMQSGTTGIL